MTTPPDIAVIGPEWPIRALLRAQLLEEGYEVVATDAWPFPRQFLRSGMKPRLVIVDLHGLAGPDEVLAELGALIPPARVLVVTALGTLAVDDIRRMGFHVIPRPARIAEIVAVVNDLLPVRGTRT
jgi:DNA-binding NtrC family response regulator